MRHHTTVIGMCLMILSNVLMTAHATGQHGYFIGSVKADWLVHSEDQNNECMRDLKGNKTEDRCMRLLDKFTYVDPSGKHWIAQQGRVVDGATIPWFLWPGLVIGPPFVGNYRRASVVHDIACYDKENVTPSSQIAHRMFYDAMLAGGVKPSKAWIMYLSVLLGGPKWGNQNPEEVLTPPQYQELLEIQRILREANINENSSPEDIQKFIQNHDQLPVR